MAARPFYLSLTLLVAACASRPVTVAEAPPPAPAPVVAAVEPPPAPTPINAGLSPAATLWHLRAGLNVAALACRGADEAAIIARYNALLAGHTAALAAAESAYAAEYRAAGGDWRDRYDDEMTRLYNFFSQAGGRDAFCAAATQALDAAQAVPEAELAGFAAAQLPLLDRPFAPPRVTVEAPTAAAPATIVAAR